MFLLSFFAKISRAFLVARDVVVVGTTAYLVSERLGLLVLDVSDLDSPVLLGVYNAPNKVYTVTVEGRLRMSGVPPDCISLM